MTTQIDKQTITIGKTIAIVLFVGNFVANYVASFYGNKAALKELEYQSNLKFQKLEYEDKLLWNRVNMIASNTYRNEAIMPKELEEPRPEVKDLK